MANIEKCVGCPVIKDGEKCQRLAVFLSQIDLDAPGFKRTEFRCDGLNREQKTVVTQDCAIYVANDVSDFVLRVFGFY